MELSALSILDVLYVCLIVFVCVIGTLLTIALVRIIRLLRVVEELVEMYDSVKHAASMYRQIPNFIVSGLKNIFFGSEKSEKKKQDKRG